MHTDGMFEQFPGLERQVGESSTDSPSPREPDALWLKHIVGTWFVPLDPARSVGATSACAATLPLFADCPALNAIAAPGALPS